MSSDAIMLRKDQKNVIYKMLTTLNKCENDKLNLVLQSKFSKNSLRNVFVFIVT